MASRVDPADTIGGFRVLSDYLQAHQVPVGRPASRVTVFAVISIEELLDGPMTSPVRIGADGPEQTGQRHHPNLLDGLSRGPVSPRLQQLQVREGVKVMNLLAVADLAQDVAELRDAGGDYRPWLDDGARSYRAQIRGWITGGPTDPRLAEFLDSFVHRADKQHAELLQKTLDRAEVPEQDRTAVWATYDGCKSDGDRQVFVENVVNSTRVGGGGDGRRDQAGFRARVDGARGAGREL
jgi:hypothetical protein